MAGSTVAMAVNTNYTVAYDLNGMTLVGVHVPTSFNGGTLTAYTCLTFDGTYVPVRDGTTGNTVTVTVTSPACYVTFNPDLMRGVRFVELVSNTNANANFSLTLALANGG